MTNVDKAAIGWSIGIVIAGVAIAMAGGNTGISMDTGSMTPPTAPAMEEKTMVTKTKIPGYERAESVQDPGVGHESHQLAILLAPSDKVYSGTLRYDASEPIQLVSLVGPLKAGEDKGQPIWTPDGKTKFALTFVDPKNSNGEWNFVGNALAVHTMKTTPFVVDYKITNLAEKAKSSTVLTGTLSSTIDPGVGHESHSLAVIIPPGKDVYSGTLSYSASENIQLVSLKGPLGPADTAMAGAIWSPDGKTNFALTFVDPKNQMGTWKFSGNALALHTMNTKGFTASYAVTSEKTSGTSAPKMMEEPKASAPKAVRISMPAGTSVPGCEETNACYIPASASIAVGGIVTWSNDDTAAHTVTSGSPTGGPSGVFDSSLVMGGSTFQHTFDKAGTYDYFCMVHPWMVGTVKVG